MDQEAILALLQADPARVYTFPEILKRIDVAPEDEKEARRALKALVRRGVLEREQGRRYRLSRAGQEVEGIITFDARNRALVLPVRAKGAPIPLDPEEGRQVEANDRVLAALVTTGKRGKLHARVIEVLDRPKLKDLGVFRRIAKTTFVELEPPPGSGRPRRGARAVREVLVPSGATGGAEDGQLVEVEIARKGRGSTASASARVVRVLGRVGERPTEMARLMLEHHLDIPFPPEVEAEVAPLGTVPSEADRRDRRDLRHLPLVTIDSETAKDFDDAVCATRQGADGFVLHVAIADVAHYVRPGTALDREALRRGTSTYLTDRAIPMLPEALSNELCSLKPQVDRLCMVVELTLDRTGHVEKTELYPAVMRSAARLTYTRVAAALEGQPDEECRRLLPTLLLLFKVSQLFLARRLKRGAIDLDLPEPVVVFDAQGVPVDVQRRPRNDAHRLIEDLMLAANEAVARWFVERDLPSLFRIHEDPDADRLEIFRKLLAQLGLPSKLKRHPKPSDVAQLLDRLNEHESGKPLHALLLRSLAQARYDAECKGHFGLAAEHYLHFTSPIRRYPDLMVHRLLKRLLRGEALGYSKEDLQEIARQSSEAERRAVVAERESMDLDRAYVALEHLGDRMSGSVTAVQGFGLFTATDHPFLEGLLPVSSLPEDYYELDELGAMLRGANGGRTYMLGQALDVEIASVNIARRQIELRLPESDMPQRSRGTARGRPRSHEDTKSRSHDDAGSRSRPKGRSRDAGSRGRTKQKPRRGEKGRSPTSKGRRR